MGRQDGIQVLHLLTYPRICYEFPILYIYIISIKNDFCYFSCDVVPARFDNFISDLYIKSLFQNMPSKIIFSNRIFYNWKFNNLKPYSLKFNPEKTDEIHSFTQYVYSLVNLYFREAKLVDP